MVGVAVAVDVSVLVWVAVLVWVPVAPSAVSLEPLCLRESKDPLAACAAVIPPEPSPPLDRSAIHAALATTSARAIR